MKKASSAASKTWFSHPALSVLLFLVWLLMQQSLSVAHLMMAALLSVALPRLLQGLLGPAMRPKRWALVLRFSGIVLWDIVVSNVTVARLVLAPGAKPQPAWVRVPLALRQPGPIMLLATIITTTPGTVSCVVDDETHEIWVHALDCSNTDEMVAQIKQRYEQPLLEIFE
ncbi:Na+/H+ antiporter subunit E [Roseateles sp.]|uniref:Na+/H+ antiporter subunit E n=1 Tax=Roseateles sp. TaxID=1971397 RepID=UPI003BA74F55